MTTITEYFRSARSSRIKKRLTKGKYDRSADLRSAVRDVANLLCAHVEYVGKAIIQSMPLSFLLRFSRDFYLHIIVCSCPAETLVCLKKWLTQLVCLPRQRKRLTHTEKPSFVAKLHKKHFLKFNILCVWQLLTILRSQSIQTETRAIVFIVGCLVVGNENDV